MRLLLPRFVVGVLTCAFSLLMLPGCDFFAVDGSDSTMGELIEESLQDPEWHEGIETGGTPSASSNPCESSGNYTYRLQSVDGESLPYRSVFIDPNNYSEVTAGRYTFTRTASEGSPGTWESTLTNRQVVNGSPSVRDIERSGTYTCSGSLLHFTNNQTGATGSGSVTGNRFTITSTVTYVFVRN